jgi:signal transduction histidine kinase
LLIVSQTLIAALLIFLALRALGAISDEVRYLYEFQLLSIAETGSATKDAADLRRLITMDRARIDSGYDAGTVSVLVGRLRAFSDRYRTLWQAAHGTTVDAARFRKDLMRTGDEDILAEEASTLKDLERSLRALEESGAHIIADSRKQLLENTLKVKDDLYALHDVNVRYAKLSYQHILSRARAVRNRLLAGGILGTCLTLFLGLHVHRAIAPRVRRLVGKVQRFREFGVNEKIIESGRDEIAILANALDAGFSAIAAREREREEFLAIAAHELKTPITSIHGYSKLVLDHPDRALLVPRALEIINRQSWRLSRLIEELFLAMKARVGHLRFQPKPLDLSALTQRVLSEAGALISKEAFIERRTPNVMILGDEALLKHALLSLLTSASALSHGDLPVKVALDTNGPYARVTVDVKSAERSTQDIEKLFVPFHSVQYEDGSSIRSGLGLYLCREIVRLHNGRLHVHDLKDGSQFSMELAL